MTPRVFYSFHYKADCERAALIRNIGAVEGNRPASPNDWEAIRRGGDAAIKKWIDGQLRGCCCTIVLIGQHTAKRRWIHYEIKKSWSLGKGVFGIYIHRLKDLSGDYTLKGRNPFDGIKVPGVFSESDLAEIAPAYDTSYRASQKVYGYIRENISDWIDEAISIRENWQLRDSLRECRHKLGAMARGLFE